jgi:hypothetical protein
VSSFGYYVQGVEGATGAATLTASAPSYTDGQALSTVRGVGMDIIFLGTTTTTLSADIAFAVRIGVLNAQGSGFTAEQVIRAGGTALTATVTSSAPGVGLLVTTAQSGGTVTVGVGVGQSRSPTSVLAGGMAFDPLTAGTTDVRATIPGVVSLPNATVTVTVSAPVITLFQATVGDGLQENTSGSLGAPAPTGGTVVRITSSNPAVALVSPNATTPGTPFIDVPVGQSASSFGYFVQGVEGASGTVNVTASAPGYTDGSTTVTVRGNALDIIFLGTSYSSTAADVPFSVRIGVVNPQGTGFTAEQAIRAGGTAVTATVTSSNTAVAELVTTALRGGSVTVTVAPTASRSPNTVILGGMAFDPLAPGSTTVRATIPNYIALANATVQVTVN